MKRLIVLVALPALLVGFVLSNTADTSTSISDTSIPDNEVASSISEANNSPASATITVTWTTVSPGSNIKEDDYD